MPDRVETHIGPLEFKDGAPTKKRSRKSANRWTSRALNVCNNSFRRASRGPAYVNK
jgi:hypothetical protein